MGMARSAPMDQYKPHFVILRAVVSHLREILPDLNHRDDQDLMRFIDQAVHEAVNCGRVEGATGIEGKPVTLVELPERIPKKLTALLTPNTGHTQKVFKEVVLMLFTEEELAARKAKGEITDHKSSPGKPMLSLATKFPSQVAERIAQKIGTGAIGVKPLPTPPVLQRYRINYPDENGNGVDETFDDKAAFLARLEVLIGEDGVEDLKTYKEVLKPTWVEIKTKVKVDVEE